MKPSILIGLPCSHGHCQRGSPETALRYRIYKIQASASEKKIMGTQEKFDRILLNIAAEHEVSWYSVITPSVHKMHTQGKYFGTESSLIFFNATFL